MTDNKTIKILVFIVFVSIFGVAATVFANWKKPNNNPPKQDEILEFLNTDIYQDKIEGLELTNSNIALVVENGKVTIGTDPGSEDYGLKTVYHPIKAFDELIIETRTDDYGTCNGSSATDDCPDGLLWLRTDL